MIGPGATLAEPLLHGAGRRTMCAGTMLFILLFLLLRVGNDLLKWSAHYVFGGLPLTSEQSASFVLFLHKDHLTATVYQLI